MIPESENLPMYQAMPEEHPHIRVSSRTGNLPLVFCSAKQISQGFLILGENSEKAFNSFSIYADSDFSFC